MVIIRHLPMEIIGLKKNGLVLRDFHIKNMMTQFKFYPSFWLLDLPLLLLPTQIYTSKITRLAYGIAKKGYKKLKGELS